MYPYKLQKEYTVYKSQATDPRRRGSSSSFMSWIVYYLSISADYIVFFCVVVVIHIHRNYFLVVKHQLLLTSSLPRSFFRRRIVISIVVVVYDVKGGVHCWSSHKAASFKVFLFAMLVVLTRCNLIGIQYCIAMTCGMYQTPLRASRN